MEAIGFWRVRSLSGTFACQSLTARTVEVRKEAMRMNLKDLNGTPVGGLAFLLMISKNFCVGIRTSADERIVIYRRRGGNVRPIVCCRELLSTNAN